MEKQHGVCVIQKKGRWNEKRIYANGKLLKKYRFIPKEIKFKSAMVNDFNQHLCGGWTFSGINETKELFLQRISEGLKPFGQYVDCSGKMRDDEVNEFVSRVKSCDLEIQSDYFPLLSRYEALICRKGTLGELFDLDTLEEDYADNGIIIDVDSVREKELKEYFVEWNGVGVNHWETGLILGYPIENTISNMLEW